MLGSNHAYQILSKVDNQPLIQEPIKVMKFRWCWLVLRLHCDRCFIDNRIDNYQVRLRICGEYSWVKDWLAYKRKVLGWWRWTDASSPWPSFSPCLMEWKNHPRSSNHRGFCKFKLIELWGTFHDSIRNRYQSTLSNSRSQPTIHRNCPGFSKLKRRQDVSGSSFKGARIQWDAQIKTQPTFDSWIILQF